VEGPALTKVIEEAGALPPIRAAEIARQTADALAVAHDMGIVHRDLKPDNIMLTKNRDGTDCVKVVDFGIAKAANNDAQKVTRTGLVVGTPEYMSPEQLAGDKLDGRSDIYSLGLVTFAMMTGKLPFPGATVQESMIARLTDEPKRLAEMKPDIAWPAPVQEVMDKALQRDAELRYASAADFGKDLHRAVAAMPESAATNAFTAVMNRLSTPAKPGLVIPGTPPKGTKEVPQTRVNRASSTKDHAVMVDQRPKSRIPAYVLAGVVFVAVGSVAALKMFGPGGTERPDPAATSTSGGQVGTQGNPASAPPPPAPVVPPVLNLSRELESIDPLASDTTAAVAREALNRLALLDSAARVADDSTLLRFRFLRGKALIGSGDIAAGCDSLGKIEGRLTKSETLKRAGSFLIEQCRDR
jgi:eukaryotic-like serine/threonine-protein kinase